MLIIAINICVENSRVKFGFIQKEQDVDLSDKIQ